MDPRDVLTRPAPPPDLTLRYGEHPDQIADIRLPRRPSGPLVVFIHGGFWRAEYDRRHTDPLAADLAERGYPVAQIEYRRVGQPDGGWPGTFSDVAAAVAAVPDLLAKHLARISAAPVEVDRPVVAGHSAGGHLALWYAGVAPDAVRGVLALAPVADLMEAHRLRLDGGAVRDLLGGGPKRLPQRYSAADPVAQGPLAVPAILVHGTDDKHVPAELSRRYVASAQTPTESTTLVELAGVEHFAVIDPLSIAWPAVLSALAALCGRADNDDG